MLCEEPTIRSMCPVAYFLAMSLADEVFSEGSTFEDLRAQPIPLGTDSYCFKYRPGMKEKPIMRSTCPNGAISEDRILSYDPFNNLLKGLGQRAGYEESMTAYCFRRAYARSICSKY
jgi:hypothetical protein